MSEIDGKILTSKMSPNYTKLNMLRSMAKAKAGSSPNYRLNVAKKKRKVLKSSWDIGG